jgi:MurNAc alpha-1-phosphate uridylyltransferase
MTDRPSAVDRHPGGCACAPNGDLPDVRPSSRETKRSAASFGRIYKPELVYDSDSDKNREAFMRVMILAAGRGKRLRPFTDTTPKALLPVGGKPLIVWHLERLAAAGFRHVIINLAHLGDQIRQTLGNGQAWNLRLLYSQEPPEALETAGGIAHVLPLLGGHPFLVINADVFCDVDFKELALFPMKERLAHLLLVDNPPHHPAGDFSLERNGRVSNDHTRRLTYAGIGIYDPAFFTGVSPDLPSRLAPLLIDRVDQGKVSGKHHLGRWVDVGTLERLRILDAMLRHAAKDGNTPIPAAPGQTPEISPDGINDAKSGDQADDASNGMDGSAKATA